MDMAYMTDLSGNMTYINKLAEIITGHPISDIIGKPLLPFLAREDRQSAVDALRKTLAGENTESEFRFKNGNIVHFKSAPLKDKGGNIIGIFGTARDITERRRMAEEKEVLQEQLRQSQKMEAIGLLAGGIAHDFNNILSVIHGYSELALLRIRDQDPLRANLIGILEAAQSAASLTRQLLAFSRRQVMEMKVADLNDSIRELHEMLKRVIGEDVELSMALEPNLWKTKVDTRQMDQVIINLAVNARDAMPTGGKLTIETANVKLDQTSAFGRFDVAPGSYVMLSVSDTGTGIAPEIREHIFEPFFTTKEKGKGTGLGLSTIYGIVKQSEGDVTVYSEPGHGTTFKIYLPQSTDSLSAPDRAEPPKDMPRGHETILIVEDDATLRGLAKEMFAILGYRTLPAANGTEAISKAKTFPDPIHLVLTDVIMPGMSGPELVNHLHQTCPDLKVLYMSGYTDRAILDQGALGERASYIQKPFTIEGLARKVRDLLDAG